MNNKKFTPYLNLVLENRFIFVSFLFTSERFHNFLLYFWNNDLTEAAKKMNETELKY